MKTCFDETNSDSVVLCEPHMVEINLDMMEIMLSRIRSDSKFFLSDTNKEK